MATIGLLLMIVSLGLIRVFLPHSEWLTEEGIKAFYIIITPFQVLVLALFLWHLWGRSGSSTNKEGVN